jgi:hypothetical protein
VWSIEVTVRPSYPQFRVSQSSVVSETYLVQRIATTGIQPVYGATIKRYLLSEARANKKKLIRSTGGVNLRQDA